MKSPLLFSLGFLAVLASSSHAEEAVFISEFMATNNASRNAANQPMVDEDKSYEDWIEIHNAGAEAVNLDGWALTDSPDKLRKWVFPPVTVAAGGRLIVWASNKDRSDPDKPLHANFKISSGGGYLALVKRNGSTIAHDWAPGYPPQAPDVSYGRSLDGPQPAFFTAASTRPTPGLPNGAGSTAIPPLVLDVPENAPAPAPGPVVLPITARIVETQAPVTGVTLTWKKMFEADVTAPMNDAGSDGDAVAGDGIWTGVIRGVSLTAGQMLRWKVTATDSASRTGKAPANNIPNTQKNSSAVYFGTVAQDPSLASSKIPVVHWFSSSSTAGDGDAVSRISVSYGGEFYDNTGVNLHGQSTAGFPKKSYNLNFPTDRNLLLEPGGERVKDLKLLSNYADKTKSRNTLAWELFRTSGVAAHFSFPVRVQRNGAFYAIADAVEDADESYLERAGLNPDGALYKMYATMAVNLPPGESGYEKKTRRTENAADLNALATGLNRTGEPRLIFGYDNVDLPATINMLAALAMTSNTDSGHKNYYVFRDTGRTNEWRLLPWDSDLSFGHNWTPTFHYFDDDVKTNSPAAPSSATGNGNSFFRFGYTGSAAITEMYLRRLRTLRDRFLASSGTTDWHHTRFNEMVALLDPEEAASSDADLDTAKWTAPFWKLSGAVGSNSPFRLNTMAQERTRVLTDYLTVRRNYLYNTMSPALPVAQPAQPAVVFGTVDYNPGGAASQDQEYFTVVNPTTLAIDVSGWKVSGGVDFTFPEGTVIPSAARAVTTDPDRNKLYVARNAAGFRARTAGPKGGQKRLVVSGYDGQLSARGESLDLHTAAGLPITSTAWPAAPVPTQQALRVSEVHYAPSGLTAGEMEALPGAIPSDFEFIELINTGTAALDLAGAAFTEGVVFTFPAGTVLAPGQRVVVAARTEAFALRYPGVFAMGNWSGRLDNNGERIQLLDRTRESVLDFTYLAEWYPEGAENGQSLVIRDEAATPWDEWGLWTRWDAGFTTGGTPGRAEAAPAGMTYALWKAALGAPDPGETGDDPDADGWQNLMEYALAHPPHDGTAGVVPQALTVSENGTAYPALSFRRTADTTDLSFTVEVSDDLVAWSAADTVLAAVPVRDGPGTETVILRLTTPAPARQWLRLRLRKL